MKISRLEIKNFRSIKHTMIEPRELCALIGSNNVGKTNILRAIDLILGEGWTTKAKIARELFNDTNKPIEIKVDFDEPVEWHYYSNLVSVNCITLTMTYDPLDCKVRLWENYPNDKSGEGYYLNEDFKKDCHFIYIPASRKLSDEMRISQWTLLGKLMKIIHDNYMQKYDNDEEKLKKDFEEKIKSAKDFLEADFNPESITFRRFVDTFKKYCEINSAGLANEFIPKLNIYNLNWFYKTLQIHIKEDFPEKDFDAEEVGAGMQNLLLISIFQTYAELMGGKVIFGIEEPENFLYPNAQKSLYQSFQELSKNSQIFYTTHNPNFIDAYRAYEIEILQKTKDKGTVNLQKDKQYLTEKTAEEEKFRIYTQFNTERNELFFARKVILVEGDSDKILWTTLCKNRWTLDLNKKGVTIIGCGGKGGVNYFIGVCKLVGIQYYFAIWDQDNEEEYNSRKDWLSETKNDGKGIEIKGNLEKFLGLPEGNSANKVKNAYWWALDEKNKIPELFLKVKKFLTEKHEPKIDAESEMPGNNNINFEDTPF